MTYKPSHISFSQLMTYISCPEHYLFRYVLGIKSPPAKAMKQGKAIHETIANHYNLKAEDGKGFELYQMQEDYKLRLGANLKEYEKELEESKKLIDREFLKKEKEMTGKDLLDAGTRGITEYHKEVNPFIIPDLIEEEIILETNQNVSIKMYIDLTDTEKIIHETKTARRSQSIQEIGRDPQLAIYQLGYEKRAGMKPRGFSKDFIILGKKEAKIQRFEMKKPDIDPESMLRYIWNVLKAIQNDIWYCIHPANSWVCSKDWCGYWKLHQELRKVGFEKLLKKYGQQNTKRSDAPDSREPANRAVGSKRH